MKRRMFDQLRQSVKEGGAILRGENQTARRFRVGSGEVRACSREDQSFQSEFALLIGSV